MKRYQLVDKRKEWPDGPEEWSEMVEREDGPYVLYSEAMAEIGDLRKRLERSNMRADANQYGPGYRGGFDERKFN